jgi:4-amino-4-deoxy-L-arabinose transferase-like glycosyltransferase
MPTSPWWAKPKFVLAMILLYLAVHFAVRMALWPTLATDDSEQALFSQHFAWTYRYRAPPLFTWMLVGLNHLIPVGVVSLSIMRYALFGTMLAFVYLTARRLIQDPRLAALSVYCFAAIHTFAESSHRELTHATTLAACLAVTWYVFVRLCASPGLGWYLGLGAIFAAGILSKWNFVILAVALPLACLLRRDFRQLVLTWKIVPAAALAAVLVLPTAIAALQTGAVAGEDVQSVFKVQPGRGLGQIVEGSLQVANAAIAYPEPFMAFLLIVMGLPFWRGLRAPADPPPATPGPDIAFIGSTIALGLMLTWAPVLLIAATEFKVRFMYPALFIVPTWAFMIVERGRPARATIGVFALILVACAIAVPIDRLLVDSRIKGPSNCWPCKFRTPFGPIAAELRAAGYDGAGTILTNSMYEGGNLRVHFPDARVVLPPYPPETWPPPKDDGPCLVVWPAAEPPTSVPELQASYLAEALHGDPSAPYRDGIVSAPTFGDEAYSYRMAYRLYETATGDCR